jgi:hypothetical protein
LSSYRQRWVADPIENRENNHTRRVRWGRDLRPYDNGPVKTSNVRREVFCVALDVG